MVRTRVTYKSNVKGLGDELDAKLLRIVRRSAAEGAAHTRVLWPHVSARAQEATMTGSGVIVCPVTFPRSQFVAVMHDKGTLGKRKIPLKQPGRQETTWTATRTRRRGSKTDRSYSETTSEVTYRRSSKALASGGLAPQYFFVRGKRHAQRSLAKHLLRGL